MDAATVAVLLNEGLSLYEAYLRHYGPAEARMAAVAELQRRYIDGDAALTSSIAEYRLAHPSTAAAFGS